MTVRTFLIGASLAAVVASLIWLLIIFWLDPTQAGLAGYVLFFLSLFLAVASVVSLLGFGIRRLLRADQLPAYGVRNALRQAVMVSLYFNVLLILVRVRLYQWWVGVLLTILFIFAELVFLSYDRTTQRRS